MFRLTTDPIDPAALREAASDPHAGAVSVFEGTVRNHHQGREVIRLEYEAHAPVAEKEGRRIVQDAIERFGLDHAEAVHRTGPLEIGESAAPSPSRPAASSSTRSSIAFPSGRRSSIPMVQAIG